MPDTFIEEISEMPDDPMGGASGAKRRFKVQFLGKCANADFPYTVANEIVATELGIVLGLNLPTVMPHTIDAETFVLVQMKDRDARMQQHPPATARTFAEYVRQNVEEIHRCIIYDLFVANNDRAFGPERRNLLLDSNGRLMLYDQGNACFYRPRPTAGVLAGIPRLDAVESNPHALFDMAHKGNRYFEFLTDWSLVRTWCSRISELPDFLIESVVNRIPGHLDPPSVPERERLRDFLIKRRHYLFDHIVAGRQHFTGLMEEP